jgi:hypothetical protein
LKENFAYTIAIRGILYSKGVSVGTNFYCIAAAKKSMVAFFFLWHGGTCAVVAIVIMCSLVRKYAHFDR